MDQSHEKMQQQNDTIEKLENEIRELKENKYTLESELGLVKVICHDIQSIIEFIQEHFELLQQNHDDMSKAFMELEEKYDTERSAISAKKLEVAVLSNIKDKYTVKIKGFNLRTKWNRKPSKKRTEKL